MTVADTANGILAPARFPGVSFIPDRWASLRYEVRAAVAVVASSVAAAAFAVSPAAHAVRNRSAAVRTSAGVTGPVLMWGLSSAAVDESESPLKRA